MLWDCDRRPFTWFVKSVDIPLRDRKTLMSNEGYAQKKRNYDARQRKFRTPCSEWNGIITFTSHARTLSLNQICMLRLMTPFNAVATYQKFPFPVNS